MKKLRFYNGFFSAVSCSCPPAFAPNTWIGKISYNDTELPNDVNCTDPLLHYFPIDAEIEYTCPEGFVFETQDLIDSGIETSNLTVTCSRFASWTPLIQPKCIRMLVEYICVLYI